MTCLLGQAVARLGWWSLLQQVWIITVTDGEGEVIEREAGCATGLGIVAHDDGKSFCATATPACLEMVLSADLIRRC